MIAMNVERALMEIANMNDPESGSSALDGDETFEAATALAVEVLRLRHELTRRIELLGPTALARSSEPRQ